IRNLKADYKIGTLSRGYGRKTKGLVIADQEANVQKIGDEPFQFYYKFADEITVAVCEERIIGIPAILSDEPRTETILLDDAFQHRKVNPHFNILLTDYKRLFTRDFTLPYGRLRESRKGAQRADCVIVSKCPSTLNNAEKAQIEKEINQYSKVGTPVFFTKINYGNPVSVFEESVSEPVSIENSNIFLVTGIANTVYLTDQLVKAGNIKKHLKFADHYEYTSGDIEKIIAEFKKLGKTVDFILTTEKDAVKFRTKEIQEFFKNVSFFFLPIEVEFFDKENDFLKLIKNKIQEIKAEKK
nr:tetraacyldisaccharide 4'-kinase [Flammeovirgaceae bacterium]